MEGKKNQHLGLLLFGTDDTKNSLAEQDDSQYQHIFVMANLDQVGRNLAGLCSGRHK